MEDIHHRLAAGGDIETSYTVHIYVVRLLLVFLCAMYVVVVSVQLRDIRIPVLSPSSCYNTIGNDSFAPYWP